MELLGKLLYPIDTLESLSDNHTVTTFLQAIKTKNSPSRSVVIVVSGIAVVTVVGTAPSVVVVAVVIIPIVTIVPSVIVGVARVPIVIIPYVIRTYRSTIISSSGNKVSVQLSARTSRINLTGAGVSTHGNIFSS